MLAFLNPTKPTLEPRCKAHSSSISFAFPALPGEVKTSVSRRERHHTRASYDNILCIASQPNHCTAPHPAKRRRQLSSLPPALCFMATL